MRLISIRLRCMVNLHFPVTAVLQWLEHLWDHDNMFETWVVRANEDRRYSRDTFSSFFKMKVSCVFSLESSHRDDSNKDTQHTIIRLKKDNHLKLSQIQ